MVSRIAEGAHFYLHRSTIPHVEPSDWMWTALLHYADRTLRRFPVHGLHNLGLSSKLTGFVLNFKYTEDPPRDTSLR
jgi:hypothetical protein